MLSQSDIDELKKIYQEEFHKEISNDEAWEMGRNLLQLFSVIARPIPKDHRSRHRRNPNRTTQKRP